MVRSISASVCAAETNSASNCDGGRKMPRAEHLVEESREAGRVRFLCARVIPHWLRGKKQSKQRARDIHVARNARLLQRGAQSFREALRFAIQSVVETGAASFGSVARPARIAKGFPESVPA